jgi:hypothetical protein
VVGLDGKTYPATRPAAHSRESTNEPVFKCQPVEIPEFEFPNEGPVAEVIVALQKIKTKRDKALVALWIELYWARPVPFNCE